MMTGAESGRLDLLHGAPDPVHLRLIGWAPLLVAAPLSMVMGAGAAMWVAILAGFVLTARVTAVLLERVTGARPLIAAAASMVYAFSPFALGVIANGQLAKMQLWCLPLLLLTAERWREMPGLRRGLEVLAAATLMGFTSPSIGLVAPVALGTWLALRSTWSRTGVALAVGTLAITALGLAIPWAMHTVDISGTAGLVPAAPVPGLQHPPALSPVATLGSLFMATGPWDGSHAAINNIAGLGAPALLSAAAALLMAWRKMALAGALVVAGAVFALGPTIEAFGFKWLMPAYRKSRATPSPRAGCTTASARSRCLPTRVCRLGQALPRHAVPSSRHRRHQPSGERERRVASGLEASPPSRTPSSWSPWLKTRPKAPSWSCPSPTWIPRASVVFWVSSFIDDRPPSWHAIWSCGANPDWSD